MYSSKDLPLSLVCQFELFINKKKIITDLVTRFFYFMFRTFANNIFKEKVGHIVVFVLDAFLFLQMRFRLQYYHFYHNIFL